tara:strand:+ start:372 stop:803 length:432 start_codon:yes stop_codon:yes gene_type:complete
MEKKNLSQKQVNLIAWIRQKWRTKSGKKSSSTGERYLPEKAIKALTKKDYKITSKLKREVSKMKKQYSKQPKYIVEQVRKYRNEHKYKTLNKKSGNYTDPYLRKKLFLQIKATKTHGTKAGQWSARKAQFLAKKYKQMGGDYY